MAGVEHLPPVVWKSDFHFTPEALEMLATLRERPASWLELLSRDPVARRRGLKDLSFRLPCRPALRFCYTYFARLGFLDGVPGLTYCRLLSIYEYLIGLKAQEILAQCPRSKCPIESLNHPIRVDRRSSAAQ